MKRMVFSQPLIADRISGRQPHNARRNALNQVHGVMFRIGPNRAVSGRFAVLWGSGAPDGSALTRPTFELFPLIFSVFSS